MDIAWWMKRRTHRSANHARLAPLRRQAVPRARLRVRDLEDRLLLNGSPILDPSFGNGGQVTTFFQPSNPAPSQLTTIVVRSDGTIVAGVNAAGAAGSVAGLIAYQSDGSVDTAFGPNGDGTVGFLADSWGTVRLTSLLVQPDDKIVAEGQALPGAGSDGTLALVRYNADGSLDTSFGTGGIVQLPTDYFADDSFGAIAVQPDGKILVAGQAGGQFGVARLNADGSPDQAFGQDGLAWASFVDPGQSVTALAAEPNGQIIASGIVQGSDLPNGAALGLACWNADGSPDSSFGVNGSVLDPTIAPACAVSLALTADNEILVGAGDTSSGLYSVLLYQSDGSQDPSFGTGGEVVTSVADGLGANEVSIQPDGKILVAGQSAAADGSDFGLERLNVGGTPDGGFGTNGTITTDFGGRDSAHTVVLQPDGTIVVAGASDSQIALACYATPALALGVTPLDCSEGTGFTGAVAALSHVDALATATIDWGDGTPPDTANLLANADGTDSVVGNHTYLEPGSYVLSVTAQDGNESAEGSASATVTDAPLTGQGLTFEPTTGAGFSGAAASFADPGSDGTTGDYTAVIDWADGQSSAASIQANPGGGFDILGNHTYAADGTYAVIVQLTDAGGSTATIASAAEVSGVATSLKLSAPATATAGSPVLYTIRALDSWGNVALGYRGTVQFNSSDGRALLPANYTFTSDDAGSHSFSVTLCTVGAQTVVVQDTALAAPKSSPASVQVSPGPASNWRVTGMPVSATAGTRQLIVITAMDAFGNVCTGYSG